MSARRAQAGFTLLELMIAAGAGMLVLLPATAMLFRMYEWRDAVEARLALNVHARETFDVIANGARMTSNGTDQTPNVYGVRGRRTAPAGSLRTNYSLQYTSNGLTVLPDTRGTMQVTCTGAGLPLPDCASSGESKTVEGWIGENVTLSTVSRSVKSDESGSARTAELSFAITNPYAAQRAENASTATERYRTILSLNREESDP